MLPFKQKMPLYFVSNYYYCANRVTNCSSAVSMQGFSKEGVSGGGMFSLRSWIEFFKEVWSSSYSRTRTLNRVLVLPAKKKEGCMFFFLALWTACTSHRNSYHMWQQSSPCEQSIPLFLLGKVDGVTGLAFLSYSLQSVTVFIIMKRSQK